MKPDPTPAARAHLPQHTACMGGWCALRDHCPHYHSAARGQPFERLCLPGRDGVSQVVELDIVAAPVALPSQVLA